MTAVAVLAAGLAVLLCFPPARRLQRRQSPPLPWGLGVLALVPLLLLLDGTALIAVVVLSGFGGAVLLLGRRSRARARADDIRRLVVEAAEAVASELRSGQPPSQALERAAVVWPPLDPVVSAARLGADVPLALERVSGQHGAEALRDVAAAWTLSHHVGSGLAQALDRVVERARGELATRRVIAAELASAQATARMVALLPVALLALSGGTGGDPWRFLLATPAGLGCLTGGLLLVLAGLAWLDRIVTSVEAGA
ncbi:MAG TPA: type II secretion system F family protein [Nocardioidaceae bacterium]|nr:type II secretion system F family protein [Nocardioidaceae bacterium]